MTGYGASRIIVCTVQAIPSHCGIAAVEHLSGPAGTLAILRSQGKIRLLLPEF
jgi:hypothetical protein